MITSNRVQLADFMAHFGEPGAVPPVAVKHTDPHLRYAVRLVVAPHGVYPMYKQRWSSEKWEEEMAQIRVERQETINELRTLTLTPLRRALGTSAVLADNRLEIGPRWSPIAEPILSLDSFMAGVKYFFRGDSVLEYRFDGDGPSVFNVTNEKQGGMQVQRFIDWIKASQCRLWSGDGLKCAGNLCPKYLMDALGVNFIHDPEWRLYSIIAAIVVTEQPTETGCLVDEKVVWLDLPGFPFEGMPAVPPSETMEVAKVAIDTMVEAQRKEILILRSRVDLLERTLNSYRHKLENLK